MKMHQIGKRSVYESAKAHACHWARAQMGTRASAPMGTRANAHERVHGIVKCAFAGRRHRMIQEIGNAAGAGGRDSQLAYLEAQLLERAPAHLRAQTTSPPPVLSFLGPCGHIWGREGGGPGERDEEHLRISGTA